MYLGNILPSGCHVFHVVREWSEFRCQHAGGSKKPRNQDEDAGYVNRFLASISFQNGDWSKVTPENLQRHDNLLRSYLDIGTVIRIHTKLSDFLTWAKRRGFIRARPNEKVIEYVKGCLQSARKAGAQRAVKRLDEESRNLPPASAPADFATSQYVVALRARFRVHPMQYLYDMGCALMVLLTFFNGSRVPVLGNLRLIDVDRARKEDDGDNYVISVSRHKTSATGRVAFLVVEPDIYKDILLYRKTVSDMVRLVDVRSSLFRDRGLMPITADHVGRMCRSAWKNAGMTSPFSATLMRKAATVYGRESDPDAADIISRKLCHRKTTADVWYAVHQDRRGAVSGYNVIKTAFQKRAAASATVSRAPDELAPAEVAPRTEPGPSG